MRFFIIVYGIFTIVKGYGNWQKWDKTQVIVSVYIDINLFFEKKLYKSNKVLWTNETPSAKL